MIYHYRCNNEVCKTEFEIQQPITSSPLTFCEVCNTDSLERIIHLPMAFIKGEPKTIGHLAHRNTEKLSSMQLSERAEIEKKNSPPKSADAAKLKKLAKLTDRQKETYVQTGKLP